MTLNLDAIAARHAAFELAWDHEYCSPAGPAAAAASAEDVPALLAEIRSLRGTAAFIARGLLQIAEQAMPDTYYATDLRCQAARETLAELDASGEGDRG